jgi:hypothetical protein
MLGQSVVRKELGVAGRDYALDWSASKQAGRMLTFYQTILQPATSAKLAPDLNVIAAK